MGREGNLTGKGHELSEALGLFVFWIIVTTDIHNFYYNMNN